MDDRPAELLRLAGWLYVFRSTVSEPDDGSDRPDLETGVQVFVVLHQARPELVPPHLAALVSGLANAGLATTAAGRDLSLATVLLRQCVASEDLEALQQSIALFWRGLAVGMTGRPDEIADRSNLAFALLTRFSWTQDLSLLADVRMAAVDAALRAPGDHPQRVIALGNLALVMHVLADQAIMGGDDRLMPIEWEALATIPAGHHEHLEQLLNHGTRLLAMARATKDLSLLERTVLQLRRLVELGADGTAADRRNRRLLAEALQERHEWTRLPDHLDEAISAGEAALPQSHPADQAAVLQNLGVLLRMRFERKLVPADLDRSVDLQTQALAVGPTEDDLPACRSSLGVALRVRFTWTRAIPDIDEAIRVTRLAVEGLAEGDPRRAATVSMLGLAYEARFDWLRDLTDLNNAVTLAEQAVREASVDNLDVGLTSHNLANALWTRYRRLGSLDDLDRATMHARHAVDAYALVPSEQAQSLSLTGVCLVDRFSHSGSFDDLNEAVALHRAALSVAAAGASDRASFLHNLSVALTRLYEHVGDPAGLTESIESARASVASTPASHPDITGRSVQLGTALRLAQQFGISPQQGPEEVVEIARQALAAATTSSQRLQALTALCLVLRARFEYRHAIGDLDEAIGIAEEAVAGSAPDDPARWLRVFNLGGSYSMRFDQTGEFQDVDNATYCFKLVLDHTDDGDPAVATVMSELARLLFTRYRRDTRLEADAGARENVLAQAFDLSRRAVDMASSPARQRFNTAARWGIAAAEFGDAGQAATGFSAMVRLLPLAAWHGLDKTTNLRLLSGTGRLVADAAAWAITIGDPQMAVELLEQGRSVLWAQTMQLRGETDELRLIHPELAAELDAIRTVLDRSETEADAQAGSPRPGLRVKLASDWDRVITRVRRLPGFEGFLRPPAFSVLAAALRDRPVVIINVSHVRADAILVTDGRAHVVPLTHLDAGTAEDQSTAYLLALDSLSRQPEFGPDGTFDERRDRLRQAAARQKINSVLAWLWDVVAEPVLHALGMITGPQTADPERLPRIWWSPTRYLTLLPIHAAGHHNAASVGRSVIDNVVSSYTPTLWALHEACQPATGPLQDAILVAAVPTTSGGVGLPSAEVEAATVSRLFPQHTALVGPAANVESVVAALSAHRFAHFACHYERIRPPHESGLALYDGRLTISRIARRRLPSAALAFLAACDAAVGDDVALDEAISISAAMHLGGFQHVIATASSIFDDLGPTVAEWIYTSLRDGDTQLFQLDRAAHAVHQVARRLRAAGHPPHQWAAYTHTGP